MSVYLGQMSGIMERIPSYQTSENDPIASLLKEPAQAYALQSFDLIRLARNGVLKKTLLQLADKLSFTLHELSKILHISERTLQRYGNEDKLATDTSERALLLAQLYSRGITLFETSENFNDWLRTPLPAFQQQAPIQFLDTAFGFQLVMDEIGRIEHGVFA